MSKSGALVSSLALAGYSIVSFGGFDLVSCGVEWLRSSASSLICKKFYSLLASRK